MHLNGRPSLLGNWCHSKSFLGHVSIFSEIFYLTHESHALTGQHLSTVLSLHLVSISELIFQTIKKIMFSVHNYGHDPEPAFAKESSLNLSIDNHDHRHALFQKSPCLLNVYHLQPLTKSPFI